MRVIDQPHKKQAVDNTADGVAAPGATPVAIRYESGSELLPEVALKAGGDLPEDYAVAPHGAVLRADKKQAEAAAKRQAKRKATREFKGAVRELAAGKAKGASDTSTVPGLEQAEGLAAAVNAAASAHESAAVAAAPGRGNATESPMEPAAKGPTVTSLSSPARRITRASTRASAGTTTKSTLAADATGADTSGAAAAADSAPAGAGCKRRAPARGVKRKAACQRVTEPPDSTAAAAAAAASNKAGAIDVSQPEERGVDAAARQAGAQETDGASKVVAGGGGEAGNVKKAEPDTFKDYKEWFEHKYGITGLNERMPLMQVCVEQRRRTSHKGHVLMFNKRTSSAPSLNSRLLPDMAFRLNQPEMRCVTQSLMMFCCRSSIAGCFRAPLTSAAADEWLLLMQVKGFSLRSSAINYLMPMSQVCVLTNCFRTCFGALHSCTRAT